MTVPAPQGRLADATGSARADSPASLSPRQVGAGARRRLLMIARDHPPINTPGAIRALGFARYLPEFGWDTSVVTQRAGSRQAKEPYVHRAIGFDTKDVFAMFGRYPRLLAVPDRNVSWLPAGVVQALKAVRTDGADAILSTGPPQTAHCIASVVQRLTGLPWVADVRDLWDQPPAHSRLSRAIERGLSRRLLHGCDRLTVVTRGIAEGLASSFGLDLDDKVVILPNGFDEEEFQRLEKPTLDTERFTMAHIGWASPDYRNPETFFAALRLCRDRGSLPPNTMVSFLGADSDSLRAMSRAHRVAEMVELRERVSHPEALRAMCGAGVLLLFQSEDFRHAVPTKTYEYLRSGRPIVAIVSEGETARLLRPFAGVFLASATDAAEIAARLEDAYRSWQSAPTPARSAEQLAPYARRTVSRDLASILDEAYGRGADKLRGSM